MTTPDHILYLHIDQLQASPINPRKRFDEAKLQELASSIKAHGVLQPLLGREITPEEGQPRRIEIIAGERRYRASKLAGVVNIPVMIRNLSDIEVLHAQVIENLQRDDLHELEEAEGYERLLQEKDRTGQPYTAETIAAEIGKSRAYVYARLKLLDLCQEARDACYAGEIDASTALLIARIPVHKLPNLTPAQHLMLIIELPLIAAEITAGQYYGDASTMLDMADELGIDADGLRKEAAVEYKAAAAAAKKAEKAKPKKSEPEAAPAAAPKVRPAATWPFPTPKLEGEAA